MSRCEDFNVITGTSPSGAYSDAVNYQGHTDGYSGTIAESEGHKIIHIREVGISKAEAEALMGAETEGPNDCITLISPIVHVETLGKTEKAVRVPLRRNQTNWGLLFENTDKKILAYVRANPDSVVMSSKIVDTTKKVAGTVMTEVAETVYTVRADLVFPQTFKERKDAVAAAKNFARSGKKATMTTSSEISYLPLVEQSFELELIVRKVISTTKAIEGKWYAVGMYRS